MINLSKTKKSKSTSIFRISSPLDSSVTHFKYFLSEKKAKQYAIQHGDAINKKYCNIFDPPVVKEFLIKGPIKDNKLYCIEKTDYIFADVNEANIQACILEKEEDKYFEVVEVSLI